MRIKRIISGGQTGADRGGLDAAIELGIPHGGWCPKGRRAEDGPIPPRYRLRETPSSDYPERTEQNVLAAQGTVVFTFGRPEGGSALTIRLAERHEKPVIHVDLKKLAPAEAAGRLRAWIAKHGISILNVAGSRESKAAGMMKLVQSIVTAAFAGK
jgi:hypothetical protein